MITRIRISGIRPGTLAEFTEVARDWRSLLERHGGRVLGFYFDETENKVTGIAEYDSRSNLSEVQRNCEADPAYADIQSRAEQKSVPQSTQVSVRSSDGGSIDTRRGRTRVRLAYWRFKAIRYDTAFRTIPIPSP